MKNRLKIPLLGFIIIVAIFKGWFINYQIIGGDWPYFFKETLQDFFLMPHSWRIISANGFGGQNLFFSLESYVYFIVTIFVNTLHLPWEIIYKIFFFVPFLSLSLLSISYLLKTCFTKTKDWQKLAGGILYVANTYILMIVGGGQMGVALAYSIAPLVLAYFIKMAANVKIKHSLLFGILLGILVMFDLRITYIALFALISYFLFNLRQIIIDKSLKELFVNIFYIFIIPFTITGLLHASWILPLIVSHQNPTQSLGAIFTSTDAVKFFSFAKLENTISLLHPNWPENIFGKVYFMRPEFLLLPLLAFSSLFFISKTKDQKTKNYILFFALLGLLGAFLAKGAQDPFGFIYLWMFEHVPGFIMFRDPTKWYTLVALSYSILIPFSISQIYDLLNSKFKIQNSKLQFKIQNYIPKLFLILTTLYLILLIKPALLGQLGGTFKSTTVPNEYIKLEKFLSNKKEFSRTLWIPQVQRFAFYTNNHPGVAANDLFQKKSATEDINLLQKKDTLSLLQQSSIKYVIIPYDSKGEIFITDRKYDDKKYLRAVKDLGSIPFLKRIDGFGKIGVYEVPNPKDHFWSPQENVKVSYKYINPTNYQVSIRGVKKGDRLVLAEAYDSGWKLQSSKLKVPSSKFNDKFNSFTLPRDGDYNLEVYYQPQKWVNIGIIISLTSLGVILIILTYLKFKNHLTIQQFNNKRL